MISLSKVIEATKGIVTGGGKDLLFKDVTTDSRSVCHGDLFIALAGENFLAQLIKSAANIGIATDKASATE